MESEQEAISVHRKEFAEIDQQAIRRIPNLPNINRRTSHESDAPGMDTIGVSGADASSGHQTMRI